MGQIEWLKKCHNPILWMRKLKLNLNTLSVISQIASSVFNLTCRLFRHPNLSTETENFSTYSKIFLVTFGLLIHNDRGFIAHYLFVSVMY